MDFEAVANTGTLAAFGAVALKMASGYLSAVVTPAFARFSEACEAVIEIRRSLGSRPCLRTKGEDDEHVQD